MPIGSPTRNTVRSEKYQKKVGYKVKGFKLKGDTADRFKAACEKIGVSQAGKITELMEEFIKEVEESGNNS